MRPTDFCHLNDLRAPVPRAFPAHSTAFTACAPHGVLGSVRLDQGTECFTALANASADRSWTRAAYCLRPFPHRHRCGGLGAWAFSSHGARCDRASDTSVASPSSAERPERLRASFQLWLLRAVSLFRVRKAPRSP